MLSYETHGCSTRRSQSGNRTDYTEYVFFYQSVEASVLKAIHNDKAANQIAACRPKRACAAGIDRVFYDRFSVFSDVK